MVTYRYTKGTLDCEECGNSRTVVLDANIHNQKLQMCGECKDKLATKKRTAAQSAKFTKFRGYHAY